MDTNVFSEKEKKATDNTDFTDDWGHEARMRKVVSVTSVVRTYLAG